MKNERVYLGQIRDAINDVEEYTSVGRDAFLADRMRPDAVIRKLEIIGEAVKRLAEDTRNRRPVETDCWHAGSADARLLRR